MGWFHGMHVKLEMAIHRDLAAFGRDLAGSAIPEEMCAISLNRCTNRTDTGTYAPLAPILLLFDGQTCSEAACLHLWNLKSWGS